MRVLIAYDITVGQPEVKEALLEIGFKDWIEKGSIVHHLPQTTFWHPNLPNHEETLRIFNEIIDDLNIEREPENHIVILRLIAFEWGKWSAMPGKAYS